MPPPTKSNKQNHGGKESIESETMSNNLWVGNLTSDVTDSDLMGLFAKHGAFDSVTSYSSRSYAFVYFKRVEDAKAAKDALQGTVLRGNPIKIEFAKPAKPCKSLWVGGFGPSVSKEELEEQFLKFGKIDDFRFLRDRNTAFVDFFRLEDASQALKSMNGKRIGAYQIRVDFLRSHPSKKEQLSDFRDAREGQFFSRSMGPPDSLWMPQDFHRNYSEPNHNGSRRQHHSESLGGQKGDGQPSNVLRVSYPQSVPIDEQMLHNAMILFGEIEGIRSFPSRHYAFVEFRSVEEAQRAKEGLQGKLFNDPRISIMYSSSEVEPSKDYPGFFPVIKGPRPDMFFNDIPFRPAQKDTFSHNPSMVPNSFRGHLPPHGFPGPDMLMRPLGPQGSFEPVIPGPVISDLTKLHRLQDTSPNVLVGGPNWRWSSPAPGMVSSPSAGMKPSARPIAGTWDVFDASQLQRQSKRSRTEGALPAPDPSLSFQKMDDQGLGLDQLYGLGSQVGGGTGPLVNIQGKNHLSPIDAGFATGGTGQGHPELDYVWRGIIAKGGTPVCHARCVPMGEGIRSEIPEVVNCSARTGLDMLTNHYADAVGFDIIFFLPDSEEDFAPYTEFLRYLGAKNRAGVAKFDDGTTLFLVPPSDFLTKVLNVAGPERLYGVVLKFPQHAPSSTSRHLQSGQPHYIDRQQIPSRTEYSVMPQEERVLQIDYNRVPHEDSKPPPKSLGPPISDSLLVHAVPPTNTATAAISQAGLTLTPELIATLASLLPSNEMSSGAQQLLGSSTLRPVLTPIAAPDGGLPQGWKHEHMAPEQIGYPLQQLGSQFNPQTQLLQQLQAYPTISNTSSDLAQSFTGNTQVQDPNFNMPQHSGVSSRPYTNFTPPSQSGQFAVSPQVNQQYQLEIAQDTRNGYGMAHVTDGFGLYGSSVLQPTTNPVTLSNQVYDTNVSQPQSVVLVAAEKSNLELPDQAQQLQTVMYGAGPGTSEVEVDKNERYRSTLQFAANLLQQIQQKQQPGTQSGQGSGHH